MSHLRTSAERGYSVAELLTVMVIMGLISTFVALIIEPMFSGANSQGAKLATLAAAERAFYRMQRDIHQSNVNGVYVCTYPAPTTCASPSGILTDATVIAIISPKTNGTGQLKWDTPQGQPQWQGFGVYWLAPDANGVMSLNYAFNNASGSSMNPGVVETAVNNALGAVPQLLATSVTDIQVSQTVPFSTIGLKMFATATDSNKTNETSFESDTVARN